MFNAPARSSAGKWRNLKIQHLLSSRRCCGRREICWSVVSCKSSASVRTTSASGFFWMTAKTARAVGARCSRAAIGPRPIGTIFARSRLEVRLGQLDYARAGTGMHDGMKRFRRRRRRELRVVILFQTREDPGSVRLTHKRDDASAEARAGQARAEGTASSRTVNHRIEPRSARLEIIAQTLMRGVHERAHFFEASGGQGSRGKIYALGFGQHMTRAAQNF